MTATQTVHRTPVPVDDQVHTLPCAETDIVHVDCRDARTVDVWHLATTTGQTRVTVSGTGHPVPADAHHIGTALSPSTDGHNGYPGSPRGLIVWHLWVVA